MGLHRKLASLLILFSMVLIPFKATFAQDLVPIREILENGWGVEIRLHESINTASNGNCVQPASTAKNHADGIEECIWIPKGNCQWDEKCYYRRTTSCFPPDVRIRMADGSEKKIADVNRGDKVWNPVNKTAMTVGRMLRGPEKKPLLEIGYGATRVRVTQKHPMVVKKQNAASLHRVSLRSDDAQTTTVKRANEVSKDDLVLGADGRFHKVEVLRNLPVESDQQVYNFEVETTSTDVRDRMIIANDVVTGDVVVQSRLNGDKLPWE